MQVSLSRLEFEASSAVQRLNCNCREARNSHEPSPQPQSSEPQASAFGAQAPVYQTGDGGADFFSPSDTYLPSASSSSPTSPQMHVSSSSNSSATGATDFHSTGEPVGRQQQQYHTAASSVEPRQYFAQQASEPLHASQYFINASGNETRQWIASVNQPPQQFSMIASSDHSQPNSCPPTPSAAVPVSVGAVPQAGYRQYVAHPLSDPCAEFTPQGSIVVDGHHEHVLVDSNVMYQTTSVEPATGEYLSYQVPTSTTPLATTPVAPISFDDWQLAYANDGGDYQSVSYIEEQPTYNSQAVQYTTLHSSLASSNEHNRQHQSQASSFCDESVRSIVTELTPAGYSEHHRYLDPNNNTLNTLNLNHHNSNDGNNNDKDDNDNDDDILKYNASDSDASSDKDMAPRAGTSSRSSRPTTAQSSGRGSGASGRGNGQLGGGKLSATIRPGRPCTQSTLDKLQRFLVRRLHGSKQLQYDSDVTSISSGRLSDEEEADDNKVQKDSDEDEEEEEEEGEKDEEEREEDEEAEEDEDEDEDRDTGDSNDEDGDDDYEDDEDEMEEDDARSSLSAEVDSGCVMRLRNRKVILTPAVVPQVVNHKTSPSNSRFARKLKQPRLSLAS